MHITFIAGRDLAHPRAGGSEMLVDQLAAGLVARGHRVTLVCGGQTGARPYDVVRNGGDFSQFLKAPLTVRRRTAGGGEGIDVLVEVCNGLPYLAPLWWRGPVVCLVNHVHADLWPVRYRPPVSVAGRYAETVVMPRVHRGNLFVAVSPSTARELEGIGVDPDLIRIVLNGVDRPARLVAESGDPLFVAFGRLADYKRLDLLLRLWERVRPVTGGRLAIAGDGPERDRLRGLAGPGVDFTGRLSEPEKHALLCRAWLLLHPAQIEGWGLVITEAAVRATPAVGFDVPGVRDALNHGRTGLLADTEGGFASAWATLALDDRRRHAMGDEAAARARALRWSATVSSFESVLAEAVERRRPA
ncbi:glycosyltransferase family 4 protein [Catenulispora subtropica]|uniref:Glycosyltransferase family 4 protein n=1 Tax=Catenulispora subtropica TaxID=450798 RepID=A0ABP5D134_9ACTN